MNFFYLLETLLISLGFGKKTPSLRKEDNLPIMSYIKIKATAWIFSHPTLCLAIAITIISILFVIVMYSMVGICAVESGGMRNFINGGV